MTPAEVMNKLMGDPELAAAMNKPNVQKAIFEAKDNHMAVFKYQDDPEVMMARPRLSHASQRPSKPARVHRLHSMQPQQWPQSLMAGAAEVLKITPPLRRCSRRWQPCSHKRQEACPQGARRGARTVRMELPRCRTRCCLPRAPATGSQRLLRSLPAFDAAVCAAMAAQLPKQCMTLLREHS